MLELFLELWSIFQTNPVVAYLVIAGLGLCVGSFLNVVIHRMPVMLNQGWRKECHLFLYPDQSFTPEPKLTLSTPKSRCPQCGHLIRWYENIPVISWLVLRGKCSACKAPISIRYPLIEIGTMLLSLLVLSIFGPTLKMFLGLLFLWILIALAFIDLDSQLLPDSLTYSLCLLGLLANSFAIFTTPEKAIWGLALGILPLWVAGIIYQLIKNDEGMGLGDSKLLGVFGAWFGPALLLPILIISSLLGTIVGAIFYLQQGKSLKYPFGPYLAIAGFIALLWGQQIIGAYLEYYNMASTAP